jgi:hypothetical protein
MFDQSDFGELTEARVAELRNYRKLIVNAQSSLGDRGFSDGQLQRQKKIIDESLPFLDAAIENRQVQKTALDEFARQMTPVLLENVDEAARAGAHMPRDEEITMQYFERLLDEPVEGRRIIFAEGLWEEPRALDLLGTHLVDGSTGAAFFGEFMRMHRDLLSDAARVYIQNTLLKSEPNK